ncbi:MAG: carboxypeptidase-like regulatory domain-containing protein [Thermoguttaceae bacterium]|nr:carboxypeptidase-like regulatory domain-containing protein [Thermoguttaceae bacterium]MDW8079824.1 carboxypeptidase-like regulatory domain-containing protein [Thermoguttaceae bacterium]
MACRLSRQLLGGVIVLVLTAGAGWALEPGRELAANPPVQDVVLQPQIGQKTNVLLGTVVDAKGQPCTDQEVKLLRDEKVLATVRSDKDGYFAFTNVPAGLYRVVTSEAQTVCRAWLPTTAPPGALPGVVAVQGDDVVRGQILPGARGRLWRILRNPWVIGGIVAAAVAIPVAIAVADDDEEAPASP